MALVKTCSCAVILVFLGCMAASVLGQPPPSPSFLVATKNCMRLVGGDVGPNGPRGRVEVSVRDTDFPGVRSVTNLWVPICEGISDETAQDICDILGYKYGRTYYAPELTYPLKPSSTMPGMSLDCTIKSNDSDNNANADSRRHSHRRYLRSTATSTADATAVVHATEGAQHGYKRLQERSLAAPLKNFFVALPKNVNYTCSFNIGFYCNRKGPYAAVECSNQVFTPAPPMPPSPPSSDTYKSLIRLVGGPATDSPRQLEPNLCSAGSSCDLTSRVEILINRANNTSVWAPVCAINDMDLRATVATVACKQSMGWVELSPRPGKLVGAYGPLVEPYFLQLPTGPVNGNANFNPADYSSYVTIKNLKDVVPTTLQAGELSVSATPCTQLLAFRCYVMPM